MEPSEKVDLFTALKIALCGLVYMGQCNRMPEGFQQLDEVSGRPLRPKFVQGVGPTFLGVHSVEPHAIHHQHGMTHLPTFWWLAPTAAQEALRITLKTR